MVILVACILSLFVLLLAVSFWGCSKVVESETEAPVFEIAEKAGGQSFESSLNEIYTSKSDRPIISKMISYPFTHNNGVISEAEKNEIISKVSTTVYMDRIPFAIDVNYSESTIDMMFASVNGDNFTHGDVFPDDGQDCHTYDKRLAVVTDCGENGTDYFDGATNLRPDGAINFFGEITPGYFCDGSEDELGAAVGRISTAFLSNNPLPDNHLYWEDIGKFFVYGAEQFQTTDSDFFDSYRTVEVGTPMLYHSALLTVEEWEAACLSNADLNQYYCNLFELVALHLPEDYYVIGLYGAAFTHYPNTPPEPPGLYYYWYFYFKIGKSVSCCDCCC